MHLTKEALMLFVNKSNLLLKKKYHSQLEKLK